MLRWKNDFSHTNFSDINEWLKIGLNGTKLRLFIHVLIMINIKYYN